MATEKKNPVSANTLDDEPVVGKRLVLTFNKEEFEIPDIVHEMDWEEAAFLLGDLSMERGAARLKPALSKVIGAKRVGDLKGWNLADVLQLANAIGERLGASIGSSGE